MKIFTLSGVPLHVHWTLLAMLLFIGIFVPGQLLVFIIVFLSVIPHEFGHVLVGQKLGVKVKGVILLPIGGVALFEKMPTNPRDEFLIVAVGPLVTLVLVLIGLIGYWVGWGEVLFTVNAGLFIFNVLPLFPTDGGRLLRALLAMYMPYERATRIAVGTSQIFCGVLFIIGFMSCNLMLCFVVVLLFFASRMELANVTN